ncbi:hypothetical protein HMI55_001248, partial [Coelomomyces lativittatus]
MANHGPQKRTQFSSSYTSKKKLKPNPKTSSHPKEHSKFKKHVSTSSSFSFKKGKINTHPSRQHTKVKTPNERKTKKNMEEEDLPSSSEDEDENELETTEVNRNPSFSAYQNRGSHASSTSSIKNHPSTNEEIVEDEEITSEEDEEVDGNENEHDLPSSSVTETHLETSDTELADEKRVRLAKAYLNELKQKQEQKNLEDFDAADIDRDLIAERLNEDA